MARKRLKIDGYMLRCVRQALNPLFIHVTFTTIVAGAYPEEAKMCITFQEYVISPICTVELNNAHRHVNVINTL